MFNFVRESPHEQGVDCIRRIDSKGHLCGEATSTLTNTSLLAHACALIISFRCHLRATFLSP